MHELSLALEICRIAQQHAGLEATPRIAVVGVDIGDDAGVEPANLEFCLEALLGAPPFAGASPSISRCPGADLRLAFLEVDDDGPDD